MMADPNEFFRLCYTSWQRPQLYFRQLSNDCGIIVNHNIQSLTKEKLAVVVALGLLHGSEAPHYFSKATADFPAHGSLTETKPEEMLKGLPDTEVQAKLTEVKEAST